MTGPAKRIGGFTLVEIAIVVLILAVLMGGLLMPMGAQIEQRRVAETRQTLATATEALLGFAAAHGRLPCPAEAPYADGAVERPEGGTTVGTLVGCTNSAVQYGGYLPGKTLGIGPADSEGYVLDAWGNRIRYAVSRGREASPSDIYTSPDGVRGEILAAGGWQRIQPSSAFTATRRPDLKICSSGAGMTSPGGPSADCAAANTLYSYAVAVVYSLGRNGGYGGAGADESQNPNPVTTVGADPVFISHDPAPESAAGGEFDDIVVWISPNVLYARMVAAGRLP